MGFFKSITSNIGTLAGAGIGAALAPSGLGFAGAALGASFGGMFGDDPQVEALRRAGQIEEAARLAAQKQQEFILQQTAPFREAAQQALPQLQAEVSAPIGQSPLFQRGLRAGQAGIRAGFGRLGGAGSSAEGLAQGEFAAGLAGGEIARRQNILSGLTGLGQTGLGTSLGALQLQSGLAGRAAQTAAGIGGVQSAQQQAFGQNLLQLGALGFLGQQQTPQPTGGTLGGNQLQFGTGFGRFARPTNFGAPTGFGSEPFTFRQPQVR